VSEDAIDAWVERYVKAWNSNHAADIGALFTDDAQYRTEPYNPPWIGRDAIVAGWLARPDEPGDTTFEWRCAVVQDGLAVVQGTTRYRTEGLTFSNLWLVQLEPDGRCSSFTEYWMEHPRAERQ
jgi:uncharacterized protein (TIGR02246 family)